MQVQYLLGERRCSSCPWEMGVDGVLSRGCWSRWQLLWGESRGTSHSCIAGPHGNTNTHTCIHNIGHLKSYELVKCAYLWTVGLSWSARRGPTKKQGEHVCKAKVLNTVPPCQTLHKHLTYIDI